METCIYCGQKIVYRWQFGVLTPIHIDGNWCSRREPDSKQSRSVDYRNFCTKTACPRCHEHVFFIRHNGGSVWVDELGWPWPKHGCTNDNKQPKWFDYIKKRVDVVGGGKYFSGLVIQSYMANQKPPEIVLYIDGGDLGKVAVSTEATTTSNYLLGAFVVVNFGKRELICSTYDIKPLCDWGFGDWGDIEKNSTYP